MAFYIGVDIGGTKIAGAALNAAGDELAQIIEPTPSDYASFLNTIVGIVEKLDQRTVEKGSKETKGSLGIGVPGAVDQKKGSVPFASNTPCLIGMPLQKDLEKRLGRPVVLANDADCAALSESVDGAGRGFRSVFGLIMGTGVGGGFIYDGKIIKGANGLIGEFGQLPLPFREASDGPLVDCACGQKGCIDKTISGGGLERLYKMMTEKSLSSSEISKKAREKDLSACRVLDQFYRTVAKAMVTIIHSFDPEIIVVSGGLSGLPGLCDVVASHLGEFTVCKNLSTKFVTAKHGAMTGLRGAAFAGKSVSS